MGVGYSTWRTLLDIELDVSVSPVRTACKGKHVPVRAMMPYGAEELQLRSFST